jgi:hypothetical protein
LLSLIAPLTPAEPHRGIAEDGAAARQTGIGARRQVDPNTLLEGMIGPQSFDDHHSFLHPIESASANHDAALAVPDTHPITVTKVQLFPHFRLNE